MYKLFIFDLDGTIVDSVDRWADLFERTLEKVGVCVPRDHLKSTFGRDAPDTIRMLITNGKTKEATEFFMQHQKDCIDQFGPLPHVREVFSNIKNNGHRIAIATGNNRELMNFFLKKFELDEFVDFRICSQDVKHGKPNPEMLLKTLHHFAAKPGEVLYIADSPLDVQAAKNAHITIGIVTTGVLCEKAAMELHPKYIFRDLKEIEPFI